MQGNGRLSGPGHPLYDQCLRLIIPDYLVLFLLYGGNNGFHLLIRGVAYLFLKDIVLDVGRTLQAYSMTPSLILNCRFFVSILPPPDGAS